MEKLGEVTDALLLLAAKKRVKQEDAANGDGAKVCGLSNLNENGRLHCLYRRFSEVLRERRDLLHKFLLRMARILDAFKSARVPTEDNKGFCLKLKNTDLNAKKKDFAW